MPSKPIVYVSRITNLSDARYCAGMGVDMLGFVVDPSHPDYVSPTAFQEMIGWISGPKRVAELISIKASFIESVISGYAPDYLHVEAALLPQMESVRVPLLVGIDSAQAANNLQERKGIAYLIQAETQAPSGTPFLIAIKENSTSARERMERTGAAGFALQGTRETSPGLKDYDHLSKILEQLEG